MREKKNLVAMVLRGGTAFTGRHKHMIGFRKSIEGEPRQTTFLGLEDAAA